MRVNFERISLPVLFQIFTKSDLYENSFLFATHSIAKKGGKRKKNFDDCDYDHDFFFDWECNLSKRKGSSDNEKKILGWRNGIEIDFSRLLEAIFMSGIFKHWWKWNFIIWFSGYCCLDQVQIFTFWTSSHDNIHIFKVANGTKFYTQKKIICLIVSSTYKRRYFKLSRLKSWISDGS